MRYPSSVVELSVDAHYTFDKVSKTIYQFPTTHELFNRIRQIIYKKINELHQIENKITTKDPDYTNASSFIKQSIVGSLNYQLEFFTDVLNDLKSIERKNEEEIMIVLQRLAKLK